MVVIRGQSFNIGLYENEKNSQKLQI